MVYAVGVASVVIVVGVAVLAGSGCEWMCVGHLGEHGQPKTFVVESIPVQSLAVVIAAAVAVAVSVAAACAASPN